MVWVFDQSSLTTNKTIEDHSNTNIGANKHDKSYVPIS